MQLRTEQDKVPRRMNKDKRKEALVLTMEECGELVQACSKVIRTMDNKEPDEKWTKNLQQEIGDVACMIEILLMAGYVTRDQIEERKKVKKRKLSKWSTIFKK